ncbi:putative membrane protein [Gracilibacillus halotolerans]|uniref:Putative membrane protein n=1 Tax=Gracilibacillus halotolerans TaxID=74386 RepID=A0A841RDV2_9BACI|nr:PH domain-containing protein [Gracilibacillus halotolerans]MBB6512160.1 putative membrane protein [Gracilibacillus halotolerans]
MYEPKRLHPAAMIISVINTVRQVIFGLIPLFIIAINTDIWKYVLLGIGVLVLLIIVSSILTWLRYTYTLEEDQIRIEQGLIVRKKRTISKHRIQSIDLSQNIVHRILGLTKVQIETAGNDQKIDAALHAVTMEEGKIIHDQLKYTQQTKEIETDEGVEETEEIIEEKDYPSKKISLQKLFIVGSTSGGFGVVLGLFALFFSQVESFIPEQFYDTATTWVVSQAVQVLIVLVVIALILLWAIGILYTVIQNWDFTITRYEKELFITRGLLEKKQSTIPLSRIQAVGIQENIVRQPLGFATVYVDIASGEVTSGNNVELHTVIFPLIRKKDVSTFLNELLPEYELTSEKLTRLPKKALPYYLLRLAIIPILASIVMAFTSPNIVFIPLIITGISLIFGWAQFKTAGYAISNNQLTVQSRMMNKDTVFVLHKRLQSLKKKQHIIHRKQKLASLDTAILNRYQGRHIAIKELRESDVDKIADWYSYEKRNSAPSSS